MIFVITVIGNSYICLTNFMSWSSLSDSGNRSTRGPVCGKFNIFLPLLFLFLLWLSPRQPSGTGERKDDLDLRASWRCDPLMSQLNVKTISTGLSIWTGPGTWILILLPNQPWKYKYMVLTNDLCFSDFLLIFYLPLKFAYVFSTVFSVLCHF